MATNDSCFPIDAHSLEDKIAPKENQKHVSPQRHHNKTIWPTRQNKSSMFWAKPDLWTIKSATNLFDPINVTAYVVPYLPHCSLLSVVPDAAFFCYCFVYLHIRLFYVLCSLSHAHIFSLLNWCSLTRASIERSFSIQLLFINIFWCYCYCYCRFCIFNNRHQPTSDASRVECDGVI